MLKIKNFKLLKYQPVKNGLIINEKKIKARLFLDDTDFDIFITFTHNKYIIDLFYGRFSNFPKNIVFNHLKKCYKQLKAL